MFTFAKQILNLFMAGIYLHIPFCVSKCAYCDFFSSTHKELIDTYIASLCKELKLRRSYTEEESIDTIYLGGGTPSLLNEKQLNMIFTSIYNIYGVNPQAEITLEANPDDLTVQYIKMLHSLPINRLSVGIQSFIDERLKYYGRRHTAAQASEAIRNCQSCGFDNISVDLIYGWPEQTVDEWEKDIIQALNLNVQHLSAYHLTYEKETRLWNLREQGDIQEVDEDTSFLLYSTLVDKMKEAGFVHYEISNFCQPNKHSRHNSSYWKGLLYLGCGAAAHSYNRKSRQWNVASIAKYIQGIDTNTPQYELEELSIHTQYNDCIITQMRTMWGVKLKDVEAKYGQRLHAYCLQMAQPYIQNNTLEISEGYLRLTSKGIFVSDGIISDLLWV